MILPFIKPFRLQERDTVAVIAPASPPNLDNLERGIEFLQGLGLNVIRGKSLTNINGYLAGTDEERLQDLHEAFLDPEVKAIICACGGYGTGRIAATIDYEMIRHHPKIFWGYSDITFLHTAIRQEAGLVTFHGPMLGSDIGKEDTHPLSKKCFQQIFQPTEWSYTEDISPLEVLVEGKADGPLVGGNLSLLVSTLGTKFEIDTKDKLLLIEDVNEEPRAVDRMLNQLYMAGKLDDASGMVIGDFADCIPKRDLSLALHEVIDHYVKLANKPAMKDFQMGHCNPQIAVPLGVQATLDTTEKKLSVDSGLM
ncbi:LD-carboxypeptidase [Siminovitchia fortis]|uniref:LD-carboxypeptidase n=1 Tax=Siminovitchia fortis TaxID=254758 RepID=A0A443J0M0_9BACI|nr:LD-carboxypeptidase [Siminovitchia fortis]RWR13977.1 LD-carboxypeptidase [Siminovitchia fortis]WHY81174.1 LD-carboxypeptidase [Siminovitchia fortis]